MPGSNPTPAPQKVCVFCGESCADRPRTKDNKGRYYCQPCYGQALQRKRSGAEAEGGAAASTSKSLIDDDFAYGLQDEIFSQAAASALSGRGCPSCGAPLKHDAVLCIHCGYSASAGQSFATNIAKPPRVAAGGTEAWPAIMGIISMVLGIGGLVFNVSVPLMALAAGNFRGAVPSVLAIVLSVWLTTGGYHLFRRRQRGFETLRKWAYTKLVLIGVCGGLAVGGLALVPTDEFSLDSEFQDYEALGKMSAILGLVLWLAWLAFWAVVVLRFFRRSDVQADVAAWR